MMTSDRCQSSKYWWHFCIEIETVTISVGKMGHNHRRIIGKNPGGIGDISPTLRECLHWLSNFHTITFAPNASSGYLPLSTQIFTTGHDPSRFPLYRLVSVSFWVFFCVLETPDMYKLQVMFIIVIYLWPAANTTRALGWLFTFFLWHLKLETVNCFTGRSETLTWLISR